MDLKDWLSIATSIISMVGMLFLVYIYFRSPDEKADKQLGMNRVACDEKHKRIDEIIIEMRDKFKSIDNSIMLIKENDIKHIEQEMRRMSDVQTKILTILEYKNNTRIEQA